MVRRGPTLAELQLSQDERETLERWARRPKSEQSLALRCKIVLARAEGLANGEVAERLGVHSATVGKWRRRFVERRLADLYQVCGQAQKSIRWRRNPHVMFRHLIRREKNRNKNHSCSGLVLGNGNRLYQLEEARFLRPKFEFVIAQPGLSKSQASNPQLELLGSTDFYLAETANSSLELSCSD
jgi:transposase-like protein